MSRGSLTALLLLTALLAFAVWWLFGGGGESGPGAPSGGAPRPGAQPVGPAARAAPVVELRVPVDLADRPTAWLLVVDAASGAPVEGAAIYRFNRDEPEAAIGFTDDMGTVALPLREAGQLVVARRGYLMRLSPTRTGTTEQDPQRVQLVEDRYCRHCAFRFVLPDGGEPDVVRARFWPAPGQPVLDSSEPVAIRGAGDIVRRAWSEHGTIAAVHPLPGVHLQAGRFNGDAVHVMDGQDVVSFLHPGVYDFDAATESGYCARGQVDTERLGNDEFVVELRPGGAIEGVARDRDSGSPVQDAIVVVARGDPLGLRATTDGAGRFRLGPLAAGEYAIELYHRDYERAGRGGLATGAGAIEVRMQRLPAAAIRGRVLRLPRGAPVAGASVSTVDSVGKPVTTTTDDEGFFALRVTGNVSRRVTIGAPGYVAHVEMLQPGDSGLVVELWPFATERRVAEGLTGLVQGIVTDSRGNPLTGKQVRFVPDRAPRAESFGGRRVLQGGRASLPTHATTRGDGSFDLEVADAGRGTVVVADGREVTGGQPVEVVPGRTVSGIRIEIEEGR